MGGRGPYRVTKVWGHSSGSGSACRVALYPRSAWVAGVVVLAAVLRAKAHPPTKESARDSSGDSPVAMVRVVATNANEGQQAGGMSNNDRQWLEDLWSAYAGHVYAYAARRIGRAHADDVVADVFTVAWRRRHERPRRELPWLYGVARRVLSDHYRSEGRHTRLVERAIQEPTWNPPFDESVAESLELSSALADLSDPDRETLLLSAWEGLAPREAAAVLGIPASAFRMRLTRARRRLRAAMASSEAAPRPMTALEDGGTNA